MGKQENRRFFLEIIERNKGILLKVAHVYCPNDEDRQDLIGQNTFPPAWKL
jgi:hypothetical protein